MNATLPPSPAPAGAGDDLDLSGLLDILLQRIWLVIGITLIVLGLGVAHAILSVPIYQADALIQVEDEKGFSLSSIQAAADALSGGKIPVSGEIEILRSREVLMQAIEATHADIHVSVANRFPVIGDWMARRHGTQAGIAAPFLGLDNYAWGGEVLKLAEFIVPEAAFGRVFTLSATPDGYLLSDAEGNELVRGRLNESAAFEVAGGAGRIAVSELKANASTRFAISRSAPITAYRDIQGGLTVGEAGMGSSILRLSYRHPDMVFARELVNAIARAYLTQNVERRSAEAQQSLAFLDTQLPNIRQSVSSAEEALNAYKLQTQTLSVDSSAQSLLSQSVDAEKRRIDLELEREALTQRYRPNHPAIKIIDEQLMTTAREAEKLNELVNTLPNAQRDLLRLQRDADVANQLYIALLNNAQQLRVAKAGTVGNVRIIDFAIADGSPVAPKKPMIVAVAGLLGLALGVAAAFIARMMRPTLRDTDEAERVTGLAVYVTIPESPQQSRMDLGRSGANRRAKKGQGKNQLLAALHPEDPAIESLRSLRTGLAFALMGASNKNIVITGPTAAVGKSFVAANLSALLATASKRVLLIDTDLRSPRLGNYFGYRSAVGLSDVLAGSVPLNEALLRNVQDTGMDVLPAGHLPPNPGELLLDDNFRKLLERVQEHYDHVVLDSAPILPVADTLAVVQHASTVFLVARADGSTAKELRDAARKLEGIGRKAKGVIFNGAKRRRLSYGYGYGYGQRAT